MPATGSTSPPLASRPRIGVDCFNRGASDNPIIYARADLGTAALLIGIALSLLCLIAAGVWRLEQRHRHVWEEL
jgi:hypothetical protein